MENRFVAVAGAMAVAVGVVGCSSSPPPEPKQPPGSLPPGTAQVQVDGRDAGRTIDVDCGQVQWSMFIDIGDNKSGAQVAFNTDNGFTPTSVQITDMAGFTGSFQRDIQGDAKVAMLGSTYQITGTASGFTDEAPNKNVTKAFDIKANC